MIKLNYLQPVAFENHARQTVTPHQNRGMHLWFTYDFYDLYVALSLM